ncbi:MAG: hypothetical protein JKY93_12495 [Gammaproteobacteria bacterium]|nr:hypothetical protein [Gammaproteobacteria bacterium]
MTETFNIGDLHRASITFSGLDGAPADPTTISFLMREPDGEITTFIYGTDAELVKDSTGRYHVDFTYQQSGRHFLKWTGTGAVELAESVETYVVETV